VGMGSGRARALPHRYIATAPPLTEGAQVRAERGPAGEVVAGNRDAVEDAREGEEQARAHGCQLNVADRCVVRHAG